MVNIPILMYHNIDIVPQKSRLKSQYVTPTNFHRQMKILDTLGFKGLSLKELKPYLLGQKKGRVCGITFDDGYEDNLIHALPVLRSFNFSATSYIVSSKMGKTNDWCQGQNIAEKKIMSVDQIKAWLKQGMSIGSHTCNHVHLTQLSKEAAWQELIVSRKTLEDEFALSVDDFCYPYGEVSHAVKDLVEKAGYLTATTTMRKRVSVGEDPSLLLPRVHITRRTYSMLFLFKILTKYEDNRYQDLIKA